MTQNLYTQAGITLPELLSLSDEEFIPAAYIAILGRPADGDGLSYYRGLLGSGIDRVEILSQIRSGPEGRLRHTKVKMLDRAIRRGRILKMPLVGTVLKAFIDTKAIPAEPIARQSLSSQSPAIPESPVTSRALSLSIFDNGWYLDQYPQLDRMFATPFNHFLRRGGFEGHWPSPYFHSDYYLRQNADVVASGINPLIHYMSYGELEGRTPNRLFDPVWYRNQYGGGATIDGSPLAHFIVHGGFETNPSRYFDAIQYYIDCPDVRKHGVNPLKHYFTSGMREGRRAVPTAAFEKANTSALVELKNVFCKSERVALFVTYTPDGLLRADITLYLEALRRNGVSIVLVIVCDQVRNYVPREILDACAAVLVRQNAGFDFAAWAHAMQVIPEILNANTLFLLNDSMIGPTADTDFDRLLTRIEALDAEIVGLTWNSYFCPHLQSYFLAIKKKALCSYWFNQYFLDVVNLDTKDNVIFQYELTFTARMKAFGFRCESVFAQDPDGEDQTIYSWASLLRSGSPFVKRSLVSGEHAQKGGDAVLGALRDAGYPVHLLVRRIPDLSKKDSFAAAHLRKMGDSFCEYPNARQEINRAGIALSSAKTNSQIKATFLGSHNYSNGLAVASRGYISSLMRTNLRVNIHPIKRPFHVHYKIGFDWNVNTYCGAPDVVIIHVNPDGWHGLLDHPEYALIESARRRVGIFVWELSTLPPHWIRGLNEMDAIIAPSEYCADIFRRCVNIPVYVAAHPVPIPADIAGVSSKGNGVAFRKKHGIPFEKRLILYIFDGSSFIARKNPVALIKAFRASGLGKGGWQLVLKTKHLFDVSASGSEVTNQIGNDKSISLIDGLLSDAEMQELFNDANIYASPHCSEGFGLTIAEAMALGKIVVATDYGGSKDYLDATCGFPVRGEIVTLDESCGPYQAGGQWAVIDDAALAQALLMAAEETDRTYLSGEVSMARSARNRIQERLSYAAVASDLEHIVSLVHSGPQHSDRTNRFR
jgi:glycosyltransferase involved in cell wall biosynthesis